MHLIACQRIIASQNIQFTHCGKYPKIALLGADATAACSSSLYFGVSEFKFEIPAMAVAMVSIVIDIKYS
jgi:hypothetical protein